MISQKDFDEVRREYNRNRHTIVGIGVSALTVLIVGAVFFHLSEGLRWIDAFYFCTISLATVGYGDIVPQTDGQKLFAMLYVVIGIGIIGAFANFIVKNAILRRELRKYNKAQRKT